jgi:hypothetical protein
LQRKVGIKGCAGGGSGEEVAEREGWWRWRGWLITWRDFNITAFTILRVRIGRVRINLVSRVFSRIRLWLLLNRGGGIRVEALIWCHALIGIGALVGDRIPVDRLFVGSSD